jgi:protein-disulfide isomerase-like protein with CxxC motif
MKEAICISRKFSIFDPLCGWCYASAPALGYLAQHYAEKLELMPSGLFSDEGRDITAQWAEYAWSNDRASHPSPASRSARTIISFC